ncbi:MAG: hypothetical protein QOI69_1833, partial [Pseudonocardiales bacterium]|nr:hypothetical protein [Pseudonocardiales bacterium]
LTRADDQQPPARRRGFPLVVWLIVGLQTMLMLGMTVLYPTFQEPDEIAHIDYVLAHRHGEWFDAIGERQYQSGVIAANQTVPGIQFRKHIAHVAGKVPVPRSLRKSFDALGTAPAAPGTAFPNQMTQHPPLYYGLAAGFSYLLPNFDNQRFDIQTFWLRLLSVLLLAPVPLLIYGAARRATRNHSVAVVAAILPLSIPTYLRTGGSVTNDSLITVLTIALAALLVRVAWGDLGRRTAILVGVVWGAALLTKGFALVLPPAIVLAYLLGAGGTFKERIRVAWPGVMLSGVIGCVIGAWWWIRNLVIYGKVQPDGFATLSDAQRQLGFGKDRAGAGEIDFFNSFFRTLGQRMWGGLGLIDTPSLPHAFLYTTSAVLVALLVVSVVLGAPGLRTRLHVSGWTAGRALSLILPTLLTLGAMYVGARGRYLRGHQLIGINSRYVVPTLLGLMICAAVVLDVAAGRLRRWLPPTILLASMAFIGWSVYCVLNIEMSSTDPNHTQRLDDAVHFVVGWAPFPGKVSAAIVLLAGAFAVATLVALVVGAARRDPDDLVPLSEPEPSERLPIGSEAS